ncbi:DUF2849 domain-containing protein [Paracoccus sp. 1_MG-2023]|uniref:DUF2849 domain-containing protein n=1 Tax=unclassified Paracoccus (in: a-proteobacteria) TaxID=2688777 RepID=UPI001C0890DB|nr:MULTISPECIES: DUF2849 domain-containing protein [unclassified Paracoccus (in: a-proteobacteria)]MBU2957487.1 DUF2849 domain-containing protein [Paracoccus sp. C2R09]MDO6670161.1 DUF2849 domain-containing protein [Paracoccus sp. 1_MG-2023]
MQFVFLPTAARPGVIRADDIVNGRRVWMTETGWTTDPAQAALHEDEAIAELALLRAMGQPDRIAAVQLVEVRRGANGPEPLAGRDMTPA